MKHKLKNQLIIGISSRALFNLDESNKIFESEGVQAYENYQVQHEDDPLIPGEAFHLVKKLLNLKNPQTQENLVEVVLISRNSPNTGLRIFNCIQKHNLPITRAVFCSGKSPYEYISALGAHLFLSANPDDVRDALKAHCAAATILPGCQNLQHDGEIRIAFDGDAVLFSDESEKIYQTEGLDAFQKNEKATAHQPLSAGPFKDFLSALHTLQTLFSAENCPIRTALVTARSAPAHERVIRTLRDWGIRIDEGLFLGGLEKGPFLQAFGADFFFDDQKIHCDNARNHVATAHVPNGITNENTNA